MKNLRAKNRLLVFTAITAMLFAALFTACGSSSLEPVTDETTYTVTFATDGGSAIGAQKIAAGKTVTKPANPTKDGEIFEGWYKDSAYSAVYDFSAPVNSDITIYAKWSGTAHKVTFNTNGGSTIDAISVRHGDTPSMPSNPTKTGYDFKGWFKDAEFKEQFYLSSVTADLTLYAKWEVSVYLVSFDVDNGSSVSSQYIEHGGKVTKPADPTRRNCIFEGWYTAPYTGTSSDVQFNFATTTITADTTIYAGWTIDGFTVMFDSQRGSRVATQVLNSDGSECVEVPAAPRRTGYDFAGWYTDAECQNSYDFSANVTEDIVLYAKWNIKHFTVTFYGKSSIYDMITVEYKERIDDPGALYEEGFIFDGWYTIDDRPFNFNSPITDDIDIYSKWTQIYYDVNFVTNCEIELPAQRVKHGDSIQFDVDSLYKEGLFFMGWYTDPDFNTLFDWENTPVKDDLVLYAYWDCKYCEVTFVPLNGGNNIQEQIIFGQSVSEPEEPSRGHFEFIGWYRDLNFTQPYDFDSPVYEDLVLYARWLSKEEISTRLTIEVINQDIEVTYSQEGDVITFVLQLNAGTYVQNSTWYYETSYGEMVSTYMDGYTNTFEYDTQGFTPGVYTIEWMGQVQDIEAYTYPWYSYTALITVE